MVPIRFFVGVRSCAHGYLKEWSPIEVLGQQRILGLDKHDIIQNTEKVFSEWTYVLDFKSNAS